MTEKEVVLTVRLKLKGDPSKFAECLNEMDYTFTSQTEGVTIIDTELEDWELEDWE